MSHVAGSINIANDVLADLAGYAALESYGVVGMASPSLRDGVAQLLSAAKLRKGVKVDNDDEGVVTVDLYVVIEYGTNLAEVSHNLAEPRPLRADEHGRRQGLARWTSTCRTSRCARRERWSRSMTLGPHAHHRCSGRAQGRARRGQPAQRLPGSRR